jgi:hypothetical protein
MEVIKTYADFLVGRLLPVRFPFDKSYETADACSERAKVFIRYECSWQMSTGFDGNFKVLDASCGRNKIYVAKVGTVGE